MRRSVLGIDLACASWTANGSALIAFDGATASWIAVRPNVVAWPDAPLTPAALAAAIDRSSREHGVIAVALDGPQGWRDPEGAWRGVGRRCEFECRTQGKTGVFPRTYPGTQGAWISFCIEVFEALLSYPNVALANDVECAPPHDGYLVLECFPTSTWRASGLQPLPAKRKRPDLEPRIHSLSKAFDLPHFMTSSHDDLQAVVAALAAAGVARGPCRGLARGEPARRLVHGDGVARPIEGFIWDGVPRWTA